MWFEKSVAARFLGVAVFCLAGAASAANVVTNVSARQFRVLHDQGLEMIHPCRSVEM